MGARSPFPKQEPRRSPEKLALSPEASEFHKLPIKMLMILRPQPPGDTGGGGRGRDSAMENLITSPDPRVPANMAMSAIIIILIIDGFSDT